MNFGSGFGGSSSQSTFQAQTSGPFGMTNVFSSTPSPGGFGSATTPSLFNTTPSTPTSAGGGIFGGNTGAQMFNSFGQQNRPFGSGSTVQPPFGSSPSFGMQPTGSGLTSPDGSQGTYGRAFDRVPENSEPGARDGGKAFLMSISAMQDFHDCQPEMLRAADYKKGHKRSSGVVQTPNAVRSNIFGGSNTFGMAGSTGTPSSTVFGTGSGFRAGSAFGGNSSTGLFNQTTPQGSSAFGSGFGSGGTFGQQPSSGAPFGSSFSSSTGTSLFNNAATSTGFGQSTGQSMFGWPQTGPSLFGNQSSTSFGTGFGQSSGPSVFSQATGSSIFGQTGTSTFNQSSGPSIFNVSASRGFQFSGASTTPSIFNNQPGQSSIFGPPSSSGSGFGGFGQSNTSLFQVPASQPQPSNIFSAAPSTMTGGNIFGQQQNQQLQLPPSGGYFAQVSGVTDPTTKQNWTPEYGLVVPDRAALFCEGTKPSMSDAKVNTYDYMRQEKSKPFADRFVSIPVKIALDEAPVAKKDEEKRSDIGWDSFALSRPNKLSLAEEIKRSLDEHTRNLERQGSFTPQSSGGDRRAEFTFSATAPPPTESNDASMDSFVRFDLARRQQENVDGLTPDEVKQLLPVIAKEDYYINPNQEGLERLVNTQGRDALKQVSGVEIGRFGYGKICFAMPVNLEKVHITDSLVIKRGRIEGVRAGAPFADIPCTVTFYNIFRNRKGTRGYLASGTELQEEIQEFRRMTQNLGGEFVSYDRFGTWVFKKHGKVVKYSCGRDKGHFCLFD